MNQGTTSYLEERKLEKRWGGPLPALVTLAFTLVIFAITWWIFQHPMGIMRLYTPYLGYNYTRWLLIICIWMAYIFDFWPFNREWLRRTHPLVKGTVLSLVAVAIMLLVTKGFFQNFLGQLGVAYFSPARLEALPGIPTFFAEEYAATAALMFAAIASWLSPAWVVAFEGEPWAKLGQPVKGLSIFVVTFLLSTLIYFVTMHSHMAILYYPWQSFTAVTPPYWEQFAQTVSGNFHVCWIMACTVVVWLVEGIWERWPFVLIKHNWTRRLALFFGIIAIAFALSFFFWYVQELAWGEAVRGHRRDAAPDWRWMHVGETIIFFLVPALFLQFYCGNWPTKYSTPVNVLIRTGIVIVGGMAIYALYYATSHNFLGTQKGYSHPQQFPMIPMIWLVNIWLINHWFMDNWPGWRRKEKSAAEIQAEHMRFANEPFWQPGMGKGLATGAAVALACYFAVIWITPIAAQHINLIP